MPAPSGWNARTAIANVHPGPWSGPAWRFHRRTYAATDSGGSLVVSGRYHRAADQFPRSQVWAALYLALGPEVSLAEVLRHFTPPLLPQLNEYRLSELAVELGAVLDCRDAAALGLSPGALVRDYDFTLTQEIAAAAIAHGAEGILVPSATALGDNLVVFPAQLRSTSRLTVVGGRDPRLYVPRPE
ncbi:MAG: RES family NAD+ phosphorylase [Chloroflexi bacterium]|nr:RES family NAD+ phosphorylase [Chloroflexota bacterium]